jgi:hypothetical protein
MREIFNELERMDIIVFPEVKKKVMGLDWRKIAYIYVFSSAKG